MPDDAAGTKVLRDLGPQLRRQGAHRRSPHLTLVVDLGARHRPRGLGSTRRNYAPAFQQLFPPSTPSRSLQVGAAWDSVFDGYRGASRAGTNDTRSATDDSAYGDYIASAPSRHIISVRGSATGQSVSGALQGGRDLGLYGAVASSDSMPAMGVVVTTRHGQVRGSVADGGECISGVPYATPPFRAGRLRPPRPVEPCSGCVRPPPSARRCPSCIPMTRSGAALLPDPAVPGEDCLNLIIWTPDLGSAGLPVMVWIPGGMFEFGTGASYNGSRFARDGIVCVSINYRVGAEGFFLYLGTAPPTWACSTRSRRFNGCGRCRPTGGADPRHPPR